MTVNDLERRNDLYDISGDTMRVWAVEDNNNNNSNNNNNRYTIDNKIYNNQEKIYIYTYKRQKLTLKHPDPSLKVVYEIGKIGRARVSVDKDGGTGNAGAGGGSGSGNNCEFKVLVTSVPYGSVANSSTTVRTTAVPAHA